MKLPFLASFIVFLLILSRVLKKQEKRKAAMEQSFWERERAANSVRRKSLDSLNYISIPLERLPMNVLSNDPKVAEYQELVKNLATQPIVNLTGYSNTDLKLEYGTANITCLSEYDQNYTVLVRTLQQWADILYDADYVWEARTIMEFAISTGTDISRTYYKLADIYSSRGDNFQIEELIEKARTLRSGTRNIIVHTLQKSYL